MSKRYMSMILAGLALFLTACGSQTPETNSPDDPSEGADVQAELPTWMDRFYNGSYEYLNSTIDPETGTAVTVMSGKRISSPYTEYVKVVEPGDSVWSEAYFHGDGDEIEAILNTEPSRRSADIRMGMEKNWNLLNRRRSSWAMWNAMSMRRNIRWIWRNR